MFNLNFFDFFFLKILPKSDQNFEINEKKFKLCHFLTKIIDAQFSPMRALPSDSLLTHYGALHSQET